MKINKKIISLFFICLATSLFTIDMGIISLSLEAIESNFSTTRNVTVWVITVFSISSAIGIISLGFLSQIFGRRYIYLLGVIGFTIFSGLCGLANNFETLLIFRALQGFFGSGLVALSQAIVVDIFSEKNRSKAISAWTFGLLAGPVIGPLLGGYIIESFSWRLIFFINVPLGLFAFIGLMIFLKDNLTKSKVKVNFVGFVFLSFAAGSLQIFLDRGELLDWFDSSFIIFLFLLSIINLILFILNSIYSDNSLFPEELFKDNFYIGGIIFAFLFGFILIPPFILMPIFLTQIQNVPIYSVGIILCISGIGGMIGTFFTSKIIFFLGNVKTMMLGLLIYIISNIEVTFWTESVSIEQIVLNMIYRGISISVYYVALANITYTTLPNNLRTYGAGLFQFFRTLGTGVAVAIFIALLNRYQFYYFEELRNFTSYANFNIINELNMEDYSKKKLLNLYMEIVKQAKIKSFNTDFFYLSISPILFFPFFFFFKKTNYTP